MLWKTYVTNYKLMSYIDVMHVEKNVCDNVIDLLLNIQDKTNDGLNTYQDLIEMRICD